MDELLDGQNGYVDPIQPTAKREIDAGEFVSIGTDIEYPNVIDVLAETITESGVTAQQAVTQLDTPAMRDFARWWVEDRTPPAQDETDTE